jgi:hypothetical protein
MSRRCGALLHGSGAALSGLVSECPRIVTVYNARVYKPLWSPAT